MAANTVSSSYITNPRAEPQVRNPLGSSADAKVRTVMGTYEIAATSTEAAGDIVLLFELRGNEVPKSIRIYNDEIDTDASPTLTVDFGLYKNVKKDGTGATVVDVDCYGNDLTTLQDANTAGVELLNSAARNIDKIGQTVAADAGEAAHSDTRQFGMTVVGVAAAGGTGTISWIVEVVEA